MAFQVNRKERPSGKNPYDLMNDAEDSIKNDASYSVEQEAAPHEEVVYVEEN